MLKEKPKEKSTKSTKTNPYKQCVAPEGKYIFFMLGYSRKKPTHPQWMGSFFNPLTPGFPEAQDTPSCLDFQDKRPPPAWISGKKNIRLKFNLSLIENTHNHV